MPNHAHIVPKRILSSLIASVSAGVVPRAGAPYMALDETTKYRRFSVIWSASVKGKARFALLSAATDREKAF